jgi:hypothetical protein
MQVVDAFFDWTSFCIMSIICMYRQGCFAYAGITEAQDTA